MVYALRFAPLALIALVLAMSVRLPMANACCMVPMLYPGSIGQTGQKAIMLYDDGREELILGIDYQITPDQAGDSVDMPDRFAWVITVPNEPDRYAVADPGIFETVSDWAYPRVMPPAPRSVGIGCSASPTLSEMSVADAGVELGQHATVGPYDIQPVRGVGPNALAGLNRWLDANGFPTEDPDHMAYFVDGGFTFLCIRVNPSEAEQGVDASGALPPLHLSFETERPYYPLRFSSRQGEFGLQLTVLSTEPMDYEKSLASLEKIAWNTGGYLRNVSTPSDSLPNELSEAISEVPGLGSDTDWYLNVINSWNVNPDEAIKSWDSDVFFEVNAEAPVALSKSGRASWIVPGSLVIGGLWLVCIYLYRRAVGFRSSRQLSVA